MKFSRLWVWCVLAGVPLAAQPVINPSGAVNAASYAQAGQPNAAIAQGSIFIVFGKNLGPASLVSAGFPLRSELAGTSASVTVNGTSVQPLMIYTLSSQLAMLMPSTTPTGAGTITVTYNGQTSAPIAVQVAAASFGIFTVNQGGSGPAVVTDANYAYTTLTHAANPGQTLVLWGTGLGKISADETQAPPQGNVGTKPTVWVGSQQAEVLYWGRAGCCAGLDQINFKVPPGISGCYVPVAVQTGGSMSNFGSIAVAGTGSVCSDPAGFGTSQLTLAQNGQSLNVATLSLMRSTIALNLPAPLPSATTTTDSASATFLRYTPAQLMSSGFGQAASLGYCTVFAMNGSMTIAEPVQPASLDAGPTVTLGGPNGTAVLPQSAKGYYGATLGSSANPPLYLDQFIHTFNVPGGADVGPIAQELPAPPALNWTNQDSISTVRESQGITVNWTNAAPNGYVRVVGYSLAPDANGNPGAGASFFCTANAGANGTGQFAVPPAVLLSLPLTADSNAAMPTGFLGVSSTQLPSDRMPPVRGIDVGFARVTKQVLKNVTYAQ